MVLYLCFRSSMVSLSASVFLFTKLNSWSAGPDGWHHHPCVWYRKQTGLFLDLLETLDQTYPALRFTHLTVVADNAKIHKAAKVQRWLAAHPRFELL